MNNASKSQKNEPFRYEQIASEVIRLIAQGTYRPGERIP